MQLGELIFALGFKATGKDEAKDFGGAVTVLNDISVMLNATMTMMIETLDKVAISLGAITQNEAKANKERLTGVTVEKKSKTEIEKNNNATEKKVGILARVQSVLKSYQSAMLKTKLIISAVALGLTAFVKKMSDSALYLDKFSSATGISANTFQKLSQMAAQSGADINDLAGAIKHIQSESVNIKLGMGGDIGAWQFLGVNPHDNPIAVLDSVGKRLKSLSPEMSSVFGQRLGLSEDIIYFLKNKDQYAESDEDFLLSDDEIKRLKDFSIYFAMTWEKMKVMLQKVAAVFAPFAKAFLYAFDRINKAIIDAIKYMEPLKKWLDAILIVVGLIAAAVLIMFAPFGLVIAGVALLVLAFEDLFSFLRGDKSLLGDFVDFLKEIYEWTDKIQKAFKEWVDGGLSKLSDMFKLDKLSALLESGKDGLLGAIGLGDQPTSPAGSGVVRSNNNSVNNSVSINVNGATDPKAVAAEIDNKLKIFTSNSFYQMPQQGY